MYNIDMEKQETRFCIRCHEVKPVVDFVFNKRSGNYLNYCVDCEKKYHHQFYEKQKAKNANEIVKIDSNVTKICIKCGLEKPLTEFSVDKATAKPINTCKACKALATKQYYIENKEKRLAYAHKYRKANLDKVNDYQIKYRAENAEQRRAYSRQYHRDHKDEIKVKSKIYRQTHKDEIRAKDKEYNRTHKEQIKKRYKEWVKTHTKELAEYNKKYRAENADRLKARAQIYGKTHRKERTQYYLDKRATDPLFKLSTQVRSLIRISLKNRGYGKDTHTYEILGCDYGTLFEHLKQSWFNNYGTEWAGEPYHIDHIIPLATAKTKQEVLNLCHYKNLQMLKPRHNLSKNKSVDWQLPQQ